MNTKNAELCNSLEEVRYNIDKIDVELIGLIAARSYYVNQAAHFKKSENEVLAGDRMNIIINKVKELGKEKGLSPFVTEKIFRTMIKAFIDEELAEFNPMYKEMRGSYY